MQLVSYRIISFYQMEEICMAVSKILSIKSRNEKHSREYFYEIFFRDSSIKYLLKLFLFFCLINVSEAVQDVASNSANESYDLKASFLKNAELIPSVPETLMIFSEQIKPDSVFVNIAAVYRNTTGIFSIYDPVIDGNNITIESSSLVSMDTSENFSVKAGNIILNDLPDGMYNLSIVDELSGKILGNSSFSVRPFGSLFNESGIACTIETFKGGTMNDTMYLISTPLNPISPPGLFPYTHVWANSTDNFSMLFNISGIGNPIRDINLSIYSNNTLLKITPRGTTFHSLNGTSSILMPFFIETDNVAPGVYELAYDLTSDSSSFMHSGKLLIGIFQMNFYGNNSTIETDCITPFKDRISLFEQGWIKSNSLYNRLSWTPNRTSINVSYGSRDILGQDWSELEDMLTMTIAEELIQAASEIAHQCMEKQHISSEEPGKSIDCRANWEGIARNEARRKIGKDTKAVIGSKTVNLKMIYPNYLEIAYLWVVEPQLRIQSADRNVNNSNQDNFDTHWHEKGKKNPYQNGESIIAAQIAAQMAVQAVIQQTEENYVIEYISDRERNLESKIVFRNASEPNSIIVVRTGSLANIKEPGIIETKIPSRSSEETKRSIIFLIDASGSMADDHNIEKARDIAKDRLTALQPGDEAALIVFKDCNYIDVEQDFTPNWDSLKPEIDSITPHRSTPIPQAIKRACSYMYDSASGSDGVIYIFSDWRHPNGNCDG